MSSGEIVVLGAIAGLTIFLGLPVGRIRGLSKAWRAVLNAGAAGVLVFLLVETVAHAFEPVEESVEERAWSEFAARAPVFVVAFAVGLLGLAYYDRWTRRRSAPPTASLGPGAASVAEFGTTTPVARLSEPRRLAVLIAVGIGVHNFAEGLAIGQSAAAGAVGLAVLLVVGFALHNATEGFGIVAPLTSEQEVPSWGFLVAMGAVAGVPTFLGTVVGQTWTATLLEIGFLALAAGSILFVVVQLLRVAVRLDHDPVHVLWGLFAGLVLGLGTELVLVAAGL
ncbi:MAG: ZIP family metal transporter [Actinomycetota bacterium]